MRLLSYNTFLLHVELGRPESRFQIHAKPAYQARATEIGRTLAGRYDVVALCEVWDEAEQRAVLAGWDGRPASHTVGPARTRIPLVGKASGLLTVVDGLPVVRRAARAFRDRGQRRHDADAFANKGVLLTEVDVGERGNLEVYSTHLIAGNDFVKRRGDPFGATAAVRQRQVDELAAFVREVHRPTNAALVVGDFNVPAHDPGAEDPGRQYERLRRTLDGAGFADVWVEHGRGGGFTHCRDAPLNAICGPDPDAPEHCLEPAKPTLGAGAARIDHAWLQRPQEAHRVAVSVASVRRRSFPRAPGADGHELAPFLSDHLALDLEMEVGPPGGR